MPWCSAVLYQNGSQITTSFVQGRFNDGSVGASFRLLSIPVNRFQQYFIQSLSMFVPFLPKFLTLVFLPILLPKCSYWPVVPGFFRLAPCLSILLMANHRHRCRSVIYGFYGLGHDGIVCCYDNDGQVCHFGSTGPHGGKSQTRVSRKVIRRPLTR